MAGEGRLARNTLLVALSRAFTRLAGFLLLPVTTAALTAEEYGGVELVQTLVVLLLPVLSLQLEQALFRYLAQGQGEEARIVSTAFWGMLRQILVGSTLLFAITRFAPLPYGCLLLLSLVTKVFSIFLLQIPRGRGDYTTYALGGAVVGGVSALLGVALLLGARMGAQGLLLAGCVGNLAGAAYVFFRLRLHRLVSPKLYDGGLYRDFLRYAAPMIPNHFSWWIAGASDRVVITRFLGMAAGGLYGAATKLPSLVDTAATLLASAWDEMVVREQNADPTGLEELFCRLLRALWGCGALLLAALPPLFRLLIHSKFLAGYPQAPILVLAALAGAAATLSTAFYYAQKRTAALAKSTLAAALLNLAVHLALVRFLGLYAASLSTLASQTLLALLRYRGLGFAPRLRPVLFTALVYGVLLPCCYGENLYLSALAVPVAAAYACILNRGSFRMLKSALGKGKTP